MSINEICFFCKEINASHSLISIYLYYRQKFESFSRAVWGENLLYVSRGGIV